jgi:hypothetical protein
LGLLGAPFVGPKKEHFWGARGCLWALSGKKGVQKRGLRLQRPLGLPGGTWGVRQVGPCQGTQTGVLQWYTFWAYWGPPLLAQKKNICGVRAGACGLPVAKKGLKNKVYGCNALGGC